MNLNDKYSFSIIVPVYNVATFVEQCIRSLYNQDIPSTDYEVIIVDDCSTDNSKDIVLELQLEYQNLKLKSLSENSKVGSARNVGLHNASGKYIWFVDSDDFVQPNILKLFYEELEKDNLEILHFDYKVFNEKDEKLYPYRVNYELATCSGTEFFFDSNELWWQKGVEAWRNVYRRSFLLENNFLFAERVMYEDVDYSFMIFAKAQRVKHINLSPYFYRDNSSSITKSSITPIHIKYWILLAIRCHSLREDFVRRKQADKRYEVIINEFIIYQLGQAINSLRKFDKENKKTYLALLTGVNLNTLKQYLSCKNFLFLRYPIFML
jgi:glycosyltransferase involved in cell wall biosynthesis